MSKFQLTNNSLAEQPIAKGTEDEEVVCPCRNNKTSSPSIDKVAVSPWRDRWECMPDLAMSVVGRVFRARPERRVDRHVSRASVYYP